MTEDAPARLKHMPDQSHADMDNKMGNAGQQLQPDLDGKLAPAGEEAGAACVVWLHYSTLPLA